MSASACYLSDPHYGYDFVVAVTQESINATLKAYLASLQEPMVNVCFVAAVDGTPTPMDYESFLTLSGGTDPFTMPDGANPEGSDVQNLMKARFMAGFKAQLGIPSVQNPADLPDIVTLSSSISTVQYNMVCSEFTIVQVNASVYAPPSFTSISMPSDNPWYMQSTVNLNLSTVENANYNGLPPAIQAQIKNMSGSAFSVQQLLFDFNSAKLSSLPKVEGVKPGTPTYTLLETWFTGAYFTEMKTDRQPLLGCSIVPQTAPAATMTITDMNLMVNQYVGSDGKPQPSPSYLQQSLSTLNYLCAADGKTLAPPAPFSWNWLEQADISDHDGVLAINRNCFRDYFNDNIANYIPTVCFQVDAHCNADGLSSDMSVDLTPGGQASLSENTGETVLSYSYNTSSYDEAGLNGDLGSLSVGTTYNMNTQFTTVNGNATVVITQNLVISCNMKRNFTRTSGNIVDTTIVDTYTLAVDESGKLGATLITNTTDNSVTPSTDGFEDFFTHSNEVAATIKQQADALVSSNLQDIPLSVLQNYIFPGGQTFAFKDVRFSNNQDLLASISYVDPTAPPTTVPS
ncbi:hypothetical protein AUP68_09341 [Ilyonectria robusta]